MEIIGAAALIAVEVVAAIIYGRMHGTRTVAVAGPTPSMPVVETAPAPGAPRAELLERARQSPPRDALSRKETELETNGRRSASHERARALARAGLRPVRRPCKAAAAQGGGGAGQARRGPPYPSDRGGDQAGGRAPGSQHPVRVHAASRGRTCRGDDRVGRAALGRRHEGPNHRPRGSQYPRAREPHRRRLHHRRHTGRGRAVRLRRRPTGDREADAREAPPGRPHTSGADRGDVLPGEVRARGHIIEMGEQAVFDAGVQGVTPS